jgi:acetolactate synthase-1/3 small subunit
MTLRRENLYTIIIFAENKPGVLYRIADLFLRRKVNIESLTVSETEKKGISRFTVAVNADLHTVEKTVKQLDRIIEVVTVIAKPDEELVFKEVAFVKVSIKDKKQEHEIGLIAHEFHTPIALRRAGSVTIELTGSENEVDLLFSKVKPFGILEFVRSGRIAVLKDDKDIV